MVMIIELVIYLVLCEVSADASGIAPKIRVAVMNLLLLIAN